MMSRGTPRRDAFTVVEMLVAMALMGVVSMVLYESFFVGMTQSSKGISRLDEVTKATRLAEHIRRILRTSTAVQEAVVDGKLTYAINYVETVDVLGVSESQDVQFRRNQKSAKIEYEKFPEARDGMNYQITFQKEGQPLISYTFRDVRFRLYGGQTLVMIYLNLAESEPLNVTVSSPYLRDRESNLQPPEQVIQEIYAPGDGPGPLARAGGSGTQSAANQVAMQQSAPQSSSQSARSQSASGGSMQTSADMPPRQQESMQSAPPGGSTARAGDAKVANTNEPGRIDVTSAQPANVALRPPADFDRDRPESAREPQEMRDAPPQSIAPQVFEADAARPPANARAARPTSATAAAAPPAPMSAGAAPVSVGDAAPMSSAARPGSFLSPPDNQPTWNEAQTIDNSIPVEADAESAPVAAAMDDRLDEGDPFLGQPPADRPRPGATAPGSAPDRAGDTDSPFQD